MVNNSKDDWTVSGGLPVATNRQGCPNSKKERIKNAGVLA
jgi:hypothetical protein